MNLDRHIWEGWTPQAFINDLEPLFDQITWQKPFASKQELKQWCKDHQPYYKKHIPEVYAYFKNKAKL